MLNIPDQYIDILLMPLCAAQLFIGVFIYIVIVRRRITNEVKLYLRFLGCFIFFLLMRPIQEFTNAFICGLTLFIRMFLLFVIAAPALITAAFAQAGLRIRRPVKCALYLSTGITFLTYALILGATETQPVLFNGAIREAISWLPETVTTHTAHQTQLIGTLLFFVFPFCYLLFHQFRIRRIHTPQTAFLVGILLFGISMTTALLVGDYSIIYPGSFLSGCVWIWAVFHDVRDMKGKVSLLKEELQRLVQTGNPMGSGKMKKLLKELETTAQGNLDVYKMQVREILLMLTDTGIAAGGNPHQLIERSDDLEQKVKASFDVQQIQQIIHDEAAEVSALMRAPNPTIEQALLYINEQYGRDLSVDEIAEAQNLSKYHFMRLFKTETGQTLTQYIKELRMEKAKELLQTESVTNTAFAVGYNDSNYFSTVFKKHTSQTPTQYKQSHPE